MHRVTVRIALGAVDICNKQKIKKINISDYKLVHYFLKRDQFLGRTFLGIIHDCHSRLICQNGNFTMVIELYILNFSIYLYFVMAFIVFWN